MTTRRAVLAPTLTLAVALAAGLTPPARAEDRKADEILKEIKAVETPRFDPAKQGDQKAVQEYFGAMMKAQAKRAGLIQELYKVDPSNPELLKLLPQRWQVLAQQGQLAEAKDEAAEVAAHASDPKLKTEAAYFQARLGMMTQDGTAEALKAAETFIKVAPKDDRGALLLYSIAAQAKDEAKQAELYRRVQRDYPKSPVAKMVAGALRQKEAVGKPFDLEFTDAIKGTTVSMKDLKGKVVVVDFWATWCGPCVAEMPTMKKLYAEYKGKGIEFIGVSLDQPREQGGLDKLEDFVAKNDIRWPQYYQGNYWSSEFSSSWGVNSIPCVFLVDADGKLYSTNARGRLEELIPELLKKDKHPAGAGGGND